MSGPDRRHGLIVAKQAAVTLGPQGTRPVIAAALLHDVGKTVSSFGLFERVVATVIIAVVGRARAATWTKGFKRRVALYARHPELGADMLAGIGSDPTTIAWAREHHSSETDWTVPVEVGRALRAADQD
jgi:HD domain